VKFDHVTFGYAADKPVLHDVTFEARGGSIIAIVGPTGAGKSTLVNLIARFYDAQDGRVQIDGMDVRDASLSSLRKQIAFVFQETYLFSDTVAANIAYGRPGITHGEIEAAARLAQAHEFIETMPKGYDTVLSERGSSLSGGQRQRLAMARAHDKEAPLMISDEATSALDSESERLVQAALTRLMKGRTALVIAHRLSTIERADRIIVLDAGRVAEQGSHAELLAGGGLYARLHAMQFRS
jgi:ABC-type multidrug transport system fused ATPase/permease subunit